MTDSEKVFEAFRNCITEPKCRDCPWEQCEQFNQKKVEIPVTLALDVINLLKEQEAIEPTIDEYGNKRCGSCGHKLQSIADPDLFCCKCGQAVKWE